MRKAIVTTTINAPTRAMMEFAKKDEWELFVVGDKKTPHDKWREFELDHSNVSYISPEDQEAQFPTLSEIIGWNCIQRRAIGYVCALQWGAGIIASVDDDNIPYENWGKNVRIGKPTLVDIYKPENITVFDPLSVTNHPELWHRGFPWELVARDRVVTYVGQEYILPQIQADLWDGAPDIDALCRMTQGNPIVKFTTTKPFGSRFPSPFNSQNTFFSAEALKGYYLYPGIGRMDDIWGAYVLQREVNMRVIYTPSSVYQERNDQSFVQNLKDETIGYEKTLKLLNGEDVLPEQAIRFQEEYSKLVSGL